jgi:hypothetical protein
MEEKERTAREVIEDHLKKSICGSIDEDLKNNFSEDLVILTGEGIFHGHEGLKKLNEKLLKQIPNAQYEYRTKEFDTKIGFLEWRASSEKTTVQDGADSYVVIDGKIVAQTIHYTVNKIPDRGDDT